jgi:hypothetical protein
LPEGYPIDELWILYRKSKLALFFHQAGPGRLQMLAVSGEAYPRICFPESAYTKRAVHDVLGVVYHIRPEGMLDTQGYGECGFDCVFDVDHLDRDKQNYRVENLVPKPRGGHEGNASNKAPKGVDLPGIKAGRDWLGRVCYLPDTCEGIYYPIDGTLKFRAFAIHVARRLVEIPADFTPGSVRATRRCVAAPEWTAWFDVPAPAATPVASPERRMATEELVLLREAYESPPRRASGLKWQNAWADHPQR